MVGFGRFIWRELAMATHQKFDRRTPGAIRPDSWQMFRPGMAEGHAGLPQAFHRREATTSTANSCPTLATSARKNMAVQFSHAAFMPIDADFYLTVTYQ